MKYPCTIRRSGDGVWLASHEGAELGQVLARGRSQQEALEKLRGEIRYRLELCPCSGESYQHVEVELVEGPKR